MAFTGGLSLKMGDGGNPESFNELGSLYSFPGFGIVNEELSITGWDSPVEEYRPGITDANEINLDIYRILNDSDQESLITAANNRNRVNFQLSFNDQTTIETFSFSLTLSRWQVLPSTESAHALQIAGKINAADIVTTQKPATDPVAAYYWNLDEPSGNFIAAPFGQKLTQGAGAPTYQTASLRSDSTGYSVLFNNASSHHLFSYPLNIMSNGVTIEYIIQPNSAVNETGLSTCPGFDSNANSWNNLWVLRFDNWGTGGTIQPKFFIIKRGGRLHISSEYTTQKEAEIIGSGGVVFGNTYHFLATIRPSNNTIELWVNGISQGSASISPAWFTTLTNGSNAPLDGTSGVDFNLGTPFVNGAWRHGGSANIDEVKIHLLEADQAFATYQATAANFT